MLNTVTLAGRLTKDAQLNYTNSGKAVANFTLAVDNPFQKDSADFIQCVVWGAQAEALANYTGKGSKVGVEGRISTRSFDNKEGKRIFVTEVVANRASFLDSKKEAQGNQGAPDKWEQSKPAYEPVEETEIDSDSLPF